VPDAAVPDAAVPDAAGPPGPAGPGGRAGRAGAPPAGERVLSQIRVSVIGINLGWTYIYVKPNFVFVLS